MKNEKEIIKLVDDVEIVKRFYAIQKIENSFSTSNLEAYKNLIFLSENIKNIYTLSDHEEIEINRLSYNLYFNVLKYHGYKLAGLTDKDKDLESVFTLLSKYNSFEKKYLPVVKKMLKTNVSDPYLLLYLLINYRDKLLKFYNNQLLIFESNCKGFNAFTNQDDFEDLNNRTNKVIKLANIQIKQS